MSKLCNDKVVRLGMNRACPNLATSQVELAGRQTQLVCAAHAEQWQKLGKQFGYIVRVTQIK